MTIMPETIVLKGPFKFEPPLRPGETEDDRLREIAQFLESGNTKRAAQKVRELMTEWQSIETAPERTAILVWDGVNIGVASGSRWEYTDGPMYVGRYLAGSREALWEGESLDDPEDAYVYPTHWMPLPPAP